MSQIYAPWEPWDATDLCANELSFVDISRITGGRGTSLLNVDPALLRNEILDRCMRGRGHFVLQNIALRGLDHETLTRQLQAMFRPNLVLHPQEHDGKAVLHLSAKDELEGWVPPQPFHTDAGHFLGLLCIRPAEDGGDTLLVSSLKLHQILGQEAPDLLERCFADWRFHRKGRPGPLYYEWPIFRYDPDFGLSCYLLPNTLRNTPRFTGTPLGPDELATLDKIDEILSRPRLHWRYRLREGEMILLNNKKVLHSRAGYWNRREQPRHTRLLLRVWVNLRRSELSDDAPAY